MKNVPYLTTPVVILALFALGCSQNAPTAASGNEVVPKIGATNTPNEEDVSQLSAETAEQLILELAGNPTGACCPDGFSLVVVPGNPADRNGDGLICEGFPQGLLIFIDNNAPGDCGVPPCIPPCGGGI
ncbi:MAG: hypothetical protein IIB00_10775 [candidate division Zixibacteria bacterium]|nr:hypothetical protein [candidate division Zixibacteria bacterium]